MQPLSKAGKTFERPEPGGLCQRSVLVQTFRQAYRFPDAIDNRNLAVAQFADNHVETVGAEVDGSDYLGSDVTFPVVSGGICGAGAYLTSPF